MLGWIGRGRSSASMPEAEPDDEVAAVERHHAERLRRHGATYGVERHLKLTDVAYMVAL